jgi:hypothetical protein
MMTYATNRKNKQRMTRIKNLLRSFTNPGDSLFESLSWEAIFVSDFSYFKVSWLEL